MSKKSNSPWARRRSRRAVLQAVYAWQMTATDFADLKAQFATAERMERMKGADEAFFLDCLQGVLREVDGLDALFAPHLDRDIKALDQVERAILRIGTFELRERPDVPARAVINEWVELAKTFGAEESFRYINGVLNRVAWELRRTEMETPREPAESSDSTETLSTAADTTGKSDT